MSRLLKMIAIPAVILGASFVAAPKAAEAHGFGYGYGYGYNSYYRPYYQSYYYPTYSYGYYPSYNFCW